MVRVPNTTFLQSKDFAGPVSGVLKQPAYSLQSFLLTANSGSTTGYEFIGFCWFENNSATILW